MRRRIFLFLTIFTALFIVGCEDGIIITQKLYISAWMMQSQGLNSFQTNAALFNEINPVWHNVLSGSKTVSNVFDGKEQEKLIVTMLAREKGIKLVPTIQNTYPGGNEAVRKIISSPDLRARHIREIVNLVINSASNYDGIDIDYEELADSDTIAFSAFIRELGMELSKFDKLLSVCVYPKSNNSKKYGQSWPELINYVDSLKVMSYNYHWSTSKPGPICPVPWLRATLEYAKTLPDAKDKIIIGLPLYGYDWVVNSNEKAQAVFSDDARKLMLRYKISQNKLGWDNGEPFFNYFHPGSGKNHIVYFQDRMALWERINLISHYRDGVKGVTFWQLGGEDPELWAELGLESPDTAVNPAD
jgi:spore germination protein